MFPSNEILQSEKRYSIYMLIITNNTIVSFTQMINTYVHMYCVVWNCRGTKILQFKIQLTYLFVSQVEVTRYVLEMQQYGSTPYCILPLSVLQYIAVLQYLTSSL